MARRKDYDLIEKTTKQLIEQAVAAERERSQHRYAELEALYKSLLDTMIEQRHMVPPPPIIIMEDTARAVAAERQDWIDRVETLCAKAETRESMEQRIAAAIAAERERSLRFADAQYEIEMKLRAEIERLQELLRGVGANRYWEGRWRDEVAARAAERERCVQACETVAARYQEVSNRHGVNAVRECLAAIRKGE